jgi:hypothetical protein
MGELEQIRDKEAIRMLTVWYSRGLDTRDWPLYRSVFLERVHIDFGEFARVGEWSADEWVENIRRGVHGFDSTQHLNGNHEITVDGDRAIGTYYVLAEHYMRAAGGALPGNDDFVTFGGYYRCEYRKSADGWKIASIVLNPLFLRGNPELFGRARLE